MLLLSFFQMRGLREKGQVTCTGTVSKWMKHNVKSGAWLGPTQLIALLIPGFEKKLLYSQFLRIFFHVRVSNFIKYIFCVQSYYMIFLLYVDNVIILINCTFSIYWLPREGHNLWHGSSPQVNPDEADKQKLSADIIFLSWEASTSLKGELGGASLYLPQMPKIIEFDWLP